MRDLIKENKYGRIFIHKEVLLDMTSEVSSLLFKDFFPTSIVINDNNIEYCGYSKLFEPTDMLFVNTYEVLVHYSHDEAPKIEYKKK